MTKGMERTGDGERERGAILPLMAIMLVVLVGTAAFAIDLGWLYWQSIEIQHGADAAALAGVVYEPDEPVQAHTEALAAAKENGFDDAAPGTQIQVIDFFDDDTAVVNESMLRVTIRRSVPTFFLPIFGIESINISRTAVAEFIEPLALGSPDSLFGDDPARGVLNGFWADSTSNYVAKEGGNRFGALCLHDGFGAGCKADKSGPPSGGDPRGSNPEGRVPSGWGTQAASGGYLFGIEVEEGSSAGLTLEIFSGPLYAIRKNQVSPEPPSGTGNFAGDSKYRPEDRTVKQTTWFMLYGPDATPGDTTDNEFLCAIAYRERLPQHGLTDDAPPNSSAYEVDFAAMGWDPSWLEFDQVPQPILDAMWDNIAASQYADATTGSCGAGFDRGPGVYVLRVLDEYDVTGAADVRDSWRGSNRFSLRVSSAGAIQPNIYAIQDMVMTAARNTDTTVFYLARVQQKYAGKDLIIELWDVGDIFFGAGTDELRIVDGRLADVQCRWTATDTDFQGTNNPTDSGGVGPCVINASNQQFNDELITITIEIPGDYTCTGDQCWWRIQYEYVGTVKDTTTWTAFVTGNPIRLVE